MNLRILKPDTAFTLSKKTKPTKDKGYRGWIKTLPCLIDLVGPSDAAHLSTARRGYGHLGRGKGQKASDRWCLPLSTARHAQQHQCNEELFWVAWGVNPWAACLTLHGLYSDMGEEATPIATELILKRELGRHG